VETNIAAFTLFGTSTRAALSRTCFLSVLACTLYFLLAAITGTVEALVACLTLDCVVSQAFRRRRGCDLWHTIRAVTCIRFTGPFGKVESFVAFATDGLAVSVASLTTGRSTVFTGADVLVALLVAFDMVGCCTTFTFLASVLGARISVSAEHRSSIGTGALFDCTEGIGIQLVVTGVATPTDCFFVHITLFTSCRVSIGALTGVRNTILLRTLGLWWILEALVARHTDLAIVCDTVIRLGGGSSVGTCTLVLLA